MKELKVRITEREERELKTLAECMGLLATYDSGFKTQISVDAIFRRFIEDLTGGKNSEEMRLLAHWLSLVYCEIAI